MRLPTKLGLPRWVASIVRQLIIDHAEMLLICRSTRDVVTGLRSGIFSLVNDLLPDENDDIYRPEMFNLRIRLNTVTILRMVFIFRVIRNVIC